MGARPAFLKSRRLVFRPIAARAATIRNLLALFSTAEIAAGMLEAEEVIVGETARDKDIRTVFYTISDGCGNTKEKIAVLKKVEREWKIAEIKDR